MKVVCINKNGWYYSFGHYYGFQALRPTEIAGPLFNEEYTVTGSFVDGMGDLCHMLAEYPGNGWEAECFIMQEERHEPQPEEKLEIKLP